MGARTLMGAMVNCISRDPPAFPNSHPRCISALEFDVSRTLLSVPACRAEFQRKEYTHDRKIPWLLQIAYFSSLHSDLMEMDNTVDNHEPRDSWRLSYRRISEDQPILMRSSATSNSKPINVTDHQLFRSARVGATEDDARLLNNVKAKMSVSRFDYDAHPDAVNILTACLLILMTDEKGNAT